MKISKLSWCFGRADLENPGFLVWNWKKSSGARLGMEAWEPSAASIWTQSCDKNTESHLCMKIHLSQASNSLGDTLIFCKLHQVYSFSLIFHYQKQFLELNIFCSYSSPPPNLSNLSLLATHLILTSTSKINEKLNTKTKLHNLWSKIH